MSKINRTILERKQEENRNYKKYMNYALDVFRWSGLPDGIESRFIERQLYEYGECFFYKNSAMGLVCLPVCDTNQMNIYGEYDTGMVRSENGLINELVSYKNGVRIWNNDLREPTKGYIMDYSHKMTQTELAIKMNIEQQKFPYIINTDKKNELSMKNLYQKIALGEPAIFVNKSLDVQGSIEVLQSKAEYVTDKLNAYRFELEREILTFLGINNTYEKAERLVVDEINSNNEFIERNLQIQLKHRQDACEKINKMFSLNVNVEVVSHMVQDQMIKKEVQANNMLNPDPKGGAVNE